MIKNSVNTMKFLFFSYKCMWVSCLAVLKRVQLVLCFINSLVRKDPANLIFVLSPWYFHLPPKVSEVHRFFYQYILHTHTKKKKKEKYNTIPTCKGSVHLLPLLLRNFTFLDLWHSSSTWKKMKPVLSDHWQNTLRKDQNLFFSSL